MRSTIASIKRFGEAKQRKTAEQSEDVENNGVFSLSFSFFFFLFASQIKRKKKDINKITKTIFNFHLGVGNNEGK